MHRTLYDSPTYNRTRIMSAEPSIQPLKIDHFISELPFSSLESLPQTRTLTNSYFKNMTVNFEEKYTLRNVNNKEDAAKGEQ